MHCQLSGCFENTLGCGNSSLGVLAGDKVSVGFEMRHNAGKLHGRILCYGPVISIYVKPSRKVTTRLGLMTLSTPERVTQQPEQTMCGRSPSVLLVITLLLYDTVSGLRPKLAERRAQGLTRVVTRERSLDR